MKRLGLALVLVLLGLPAHADIRLKIDEIAKGSSVTYLLDDGTRQTHHFEGRKGDTYEITYWNGRGKGLDAGVVGIGLYDADGRMVRGKRTTGPWMTYTPHNCFRVIGECLYTVTSEDGRTWNMGRRQARTETGFTFVNFIRKDNVTTVTARGEVTLDDKGMMKTLTIDPGQNTRLPGLTQERADYR